MTEQRDLPIFPIYDLHLHTTMSDGKMDISFLIETAQRKGYTIGVSDHLSSYANKSLNGDIEISTYLKFLTDYPVLKGGELDLGGSLPFSNELLPQFDYLIGSMHFVNLPGKGSISLWDLETPLGDLAEYMESYISQFEQALATLPINIVGHPTYIALKLREEYNQLWTPERRQRLINAALKYEVAFEISTRYQMPSDTFIRDALAAGCYFTVASDGHHRDQICYIDYSLETVRRLAIPAEKIWWPAKIAGQTPSAKLARL